ncbi:DUF6993 domain-containing protein [Frondihabitans cladoniiphilus]|uniref:DUF6993 domain-containing protein n=1 Tax=Frondihabitans cladoniiphilus TaxID=715785 RepID=A0ABP8VRQ4_9MICO
MTLRPSLSPRILVAAGVAIVSIVALAGCTNAPVPKVDDSSVVSAPSSSTPASPEASAQPNPAATSESAPPSASATLDPSTPGALSKFDGVVTTLLASDSGAKGRDVIDALVAAGFDKSAMQVTPDTTTTGRAVDSIEFSVLWKGTSCLVGQIGAQGFSSASAPVLSTGKCLIGSTRAIDW